MPCYGVIASTDTAKSVCVINAVTGEVVFEKDSETRKSMASTTKIVTLLTALKHSNPDEIVTVCKEAPLTEGSSAYIKAGAKLTMRDILYGLMLNSGNDAAVAVAYHISGSVENFAELMNDTVKDIGVTNTNFKNPNGLEEEGHYTTAYDLAKITQYAMTDENFKKIVSAKSYTATMTLEDGNVEYIEYINHNRLLRELEGCTGVKTGFTKAAGRCLVSATERDGAEYIVVTLNDSDDWNTHKTLHEEAYKSQLYKAIIKKGDCIKHITSGKIESGLVMAEEYGVYVSTDSRHNFEVVSHIPQNIDFPINKGEKVGYVEIKANDRTIGKVDVVSDCDFVPKGDTKVKNCFLFTVLTIFRNIF